MTASFLLLKAYWKQIAGVLALAFVLYLGYNKIYTIGYDEATTKYTQEFKEYQEKIGQRITKIEDNSTALIEAATIADIARKKSFNDILLTIKGKPLYTIKQGNCTPSEDFIKAYNDGVTRANTP